MVVRPAARSRVGVVAIGGGPVVWCRDHPGGGVVAKRGARLLKRLFSEPVHTDASPRVPAEPTQRTISGRICVKRDHPGGGVVAAMVVHPAAVRDHAWTWSRSGGRLWFAMVARPPIEMSTSRASANRRGAQSSTRSHPENNCKSNLCETRPLWGSAGKIWVLQN